MDEGCCSVGGLFAWTAQSPGFDTFLGFLWLQENTMTKKQVGEGRDVGFCFLTFPDHSPSLEEVGTGTQTGQDPRGRS